MKNMMVRGIDPELGEQLKGAAKKAGKSVNQLVVETLRDRFGPVQRKGFNVVHHDIDDLFGKWTEEEFQLIQGRIEEQRQIDPELWK